MTEKIINPISVLLLMIVISGGIFIGLQNQKVNLYEDILDADAKLTEAGTLLDEANAHYEKASIHYENNYWESVESNCVEARNEYSEHSQILREIRHPLSEKNKITLVLREMLTELIVIDESMYEACEHFESAARYYKVYYDQLDEFHYTFEAGGEQIQMMNEKIVSHDDAVRRHNDLLAEYSTLIKGEY